MAENLVLVKLRDYAKTMFYECGQLGCRPNDMVIVEAERGLDYGMVVVAESPPPAERQQEGPVRNVTRLATGADREIIARNRQDCRSVVDAAKKKISERGLLMKVIAAEYSFDRGKIVFYFTADGRVDFRELVRDLAQMFKARIELKQIGVRDELKMFGGFGNCGRRLCCASFLKDFEPVTIRMAKQQNVPLNPEKISGVCGRLMCCLAYEYQTYKEYSKCLPKPGQMIDTPEGKARVLSVDVLKVQALVEYADERKQTISFAHACEQSCGKHDER